MSSGKVVEHSTAIFLGDRGMNFVVTVASEQVLALTGKSKVDLGLESRFLQITLTP